MISTMTDQADTNQGTAAPARWLGGNFRSNIRELRQFLRARKARRREPACAVEWLPFAISIFSFVLIALVVLDAPVGAYRRQWPDDLRSLARAVTDIGESYWYLVPTGVFILLGLMVDWRGLGRRRRWLMANWFALSGYAFVTIAGSGLIATTLKRVIGRARPKHFEEHGLLAFDNFAASASFASFPSGHATTVGAVTAIIALLFPGLRGVALIFGVALASTRILVGAHYPSDVIAGLGFGMWFAYFTALMFAGRGLIFTAGPAALPAVNRSFSRFMAATKPGFLSTVPFLQRRPAKSS